MENRKLPNATVVLVLSILSILFCWCYGILGLIFSSIALILANKDMKLYRENPQNYDNYGNLKAGRIIAIIGLILAILVILMFVAVLALIGFENLGDPEKVQDILREMQKQ